MFIKSSRLTVVRSRGSAFCAQPLAASDTPSAKAHARRRERGAGLVSSRFARCHLVNFIRSTVIFDPYFSETRFLTKT